MRIPERDVTYVYRLICLLTYVIHRYLLNRKQSYYALHEVNLIQLKTFEFELDFARYIQ